MKVYVASAMLVTAITTWFLYTIYIVYENRSLKANQCITSSIRSDDLGLKRQPKPALTDYERYLLERNHDDDRSGQIGAGASR